ncbi:MAG TPA: trigger factor, partial [Vicinamibacterales bacterium]|nr:trigger factor [Vicinamibacterales bacterium]
MKTEFTDVSETQKTLTIEIPSEVVDAEIDRVAKSYSRQARIPGFRPGKVPATVVKQRFRDQILHDVMHGLIPRAVEEALNERGIEPVDTPSIKEVALREGQPLRFTADIETVPAFDPGDLSAIEVRRPPTAVADDAVDRAVERLRERAARYEPVEGRPVADGDTVVVDIERRDADGQVDRHEGVTI